MTIQLRKRFCDGLCLDEEVEELVQLLLGDWLMKDIML